MNNSKAVKSLTKEVERVMAKLVKRAKSKGVYENFGQRELGKLEDKYLSLDLPYEEERQIQSILADLDNWVAEFDLSDII